MPNKGVSFAPALGPMDENEATVPLKQPKRVIICTNTLPVDMEKKDGRWTCKFDRDSLYEDGPLYVALRELQSDGMEVSYVGCTRAFVPSREREDVEIELAKMNCYPVWCDPKRAHNHFQGYCKGILWPTFHNIIDLYSRIDAKTVLQHTVTQDDDIFSSGGGPDRLQRTTSAHTEDSAHGGSESSWAPARSWSPMEAESCWPDYCAMNGLFAQKVVEIYSIGDIIWANDYHLLLLPNYLLRKLINARIGLFLHVPFPSSEIFRTLATREEILRAMLCADHIGFDLYEYARHFFTCCSRMLGLTYEAKPGGVIAVNNNGREVYITCSHVGINTSYVKDRIASPEVQTLARRISIGLLLKEQQIADAAGGAKYASPRSGHPASTLSAHNSLAATVEKRQMIIAIDEVEGLRGLGLKLLALDRLFTDYAYLRNRVVLKQYGLILDSRPEDYKACHEEVVALVDLLREKWGNVVEYEERKVIPLDERLALFQSADVFLGTSIRVGMDMLPFEYLLARKTAAGCIVMSEFAACSRVLHGALRINPFKTSALAATIEEALSMSLSERTARSARDLEYVERNPTIDWAKRILSDIEHAHRDVSEPLTKYGGGFGTKVIPFGSSKGQRQQELESLEICEHFRKARRRLILIDYSGTLVETTSIEMYMKRGGAARTWHYEKGGSRRPGGCLETRDPIPDTTRSVLIDLCRDPANTVVVISSDLHEELDHALEGVPNLALIAENGFVFRVKPGEQWISAVDSDGEGGGDWYGGNSAEGMYSTSAETESLGESSDGASVMDVDGASATTMKKWQDLTHHLMSSYANRTNGSFVWKSASAVSYNYILSDPELGRLQASNLVLELEQELALLPLTVEQGKGFVTVRLRGVNRGAAVRELIAHLNFGSKVKSSPIDFIACFGDDNEDESAFHATNKYRSHDSNVRTYSVRVGDSSHSKAKFFVHDTEDVSNILSDLVKATATGKVRRNFSSGDFRSENPLGNFKTKQSFVSLQQTEENANNGMDLSSAGAAGGGVGGGMKHSASYVVTSDKEMAELFGSSPPSLQQPAAMPPPVIPPPTATATMTYAMEQGGMMSPPIPPTSLPVAGEGGSDVRAIPPTNYAESEDDDGEYDDSDDEEGQRNHIPLRDTAGSEFYTSTDTLEDDHEDVAFHEAILEANTVAYKASSSSVAASSSSSDDGMFENENTRLIIAALSGAIIAWVLMKSTSAH